MTVHCEACSVDYDDAARLTYCPHAPLMSDKQLIQKDLALGLLGNPVWFAHMIGGERFHVQSVNYEGMITLDRLPGLFAPHLFVRVT